MKQALKQNFVLVLAFALPILLIVIVALSTYIPAAFLSTNYNFIYASCAVDSNYYPGSCNNYLQQRYSVNNGGLVINDINPNQDSDKDGVPDMKEGYNTRIFLHDTERNESREITLEEAQTLELNELLTSPDGVTVSGNYDRGAEVFPFFDHGSSYGYYLTKGKSRSKLNLINNDDRYYYQNNFQFIGWVLPGRN